MLYTLCGRSYEDEIEATKLETDHSFGNIVQANSLFTYTDSQ